MTRQGIAQVVNSYQTSDVGFPVKCDVDKNHAALVCGDDAEMLVCPDCGYRLPLTHGLYETIADVMRTGEFRPLRLLRHVDRACRSG
jgi:hypothetical protein